jgi:MerR family transcriptional regulator, thiopeptide resistance regulator
MANAFKPMRVGDVAKRTGMSVRTLHHYEEVGLLRPSRSSESRYRLYDEGDLLRLLQIKALRQLGFSLQEITVLLGRGNHSPQAVIEQRIAALDQQIETQLKMRQRLEGLAAALRSGRSPSGPELIEVIEAMIMFEKYFSPEQLEELRLRGESLGEAHIREVESEWPRLIEKVRKEMALGTTPDHPRVQDLAERWTELVREFSGGNTGIEKSAATMARQEPSARQRMGLDSAIFEYISRANAAKK